MSLPRQYSSAEELERHLGDPRDPECAFSFARSVELDEAEEFPEEAVRLLDEWELWGYFIPEEEGGRLRSYEELLMLLRAVSRRDLTAAIAYCKTYLGAVAAWIAGSPEQRRKVSDIIRRGGRLSLAYNERAHGSDLMAAEVSARETAEGYVIDGEKWLINNAALADAVTVFAKTDEAGGPRGFSLLLVEKDALDADCYEPLPKQKTLGARGGRINRIRFKGCRGSGDALI